MRCDTDCCFVYTLSYQRLMRAACCLVRAVCITWRIFSDTWRVDPFYMTFTGLRSVSTVS